jgi:histidinol-phosphatase (PHP family)
MILNNYHTHTKYCDGSDEPDNYVAEAIKKGLKSLGFSGHAPVPFETSWSIKKENLENYCNAVGYMKEKYSGLINIYLSLEIDYIPEITTDFKKLIKDCSLDYTIGSVHLVKNKTQQELWFIDGPEKGYITGLETVFEGNIQVAVETYYRQICEMVKTQKPDIIGHFDKIKMNNKNRFFSEEEKWYKKIVSKSLEYIAGTKSIIEVNTRGLYKHKTNSLFPSVSILEQCYKLDIPVTISSDTHVPNELTNFFEETLIILKDIGYKKISYLTKNGWKNQTV